MALRIIMPKLTYEMTEGRILEWLVSAGETVAVGQPLFAVETDKAAVEVPAEDAGVILAVLAPAGQTVPVGTAVAYLGSPGETLSLPGDARVRAPDEPSVPAAAPVQDSRSTASLSRAAGDEAVPASPIARRLARELGIDLRDVLDFAGGSRVREGDVQAYAARRSPASSAPAGENAAGAPGRVGPAEGPAFELVHPTPLQRAMASRMAQAAAVPQMAAGCEIDFARLQAFRKEHGARWEQAQGFQLSLTHLLAYLVARALGDHPTLNASWTDQGIRLYRRVDLGVAMATERGLVVPIVRNAGSCSLESMASEIVRLQRAAAQNRLAPGDLEGGTFTVTNVGMLGVELSIPLLNPPQSAILGIGAARGRPVVKVGELEMHPLAMVTVVADHRVVDGAAAAAFLRRCKELIEEPASVLPAVAG